MLDINNFIEAAFMDWFNSDKNFNLELPDGRIVKRFELISNSRKPQFYIIDKLEKIIYKYDKRTKKQVVVNVHNHKNDYYKDSIYLFYVYQKPILMDIHYNIVNFWMLHNGTDEEHREYKRKREIARMTDDMRKKRTTQAKIPLDIGDGVKTFTQGIQFCSMEDAINFLKIKFDFDVLTLQAEAYITTLITTDRCAMDDEALVEGRKVMASQNKYKQKFKLNK